MSRKVFAASLPLTLLPLLLIGCAPDQDNPSTPSPFHKESGGTFASPASARVRDCARAPSVPFVRITSPTGMSLWSNGSEYLVVEGGQVLVRFEAPSTANTVIRPFSRASIPPGVSLWANGCSYKIVRGGTVVAEFERPAAAVQSRQLTGPSEVAGPPLPFSYAESEGVQPPSIYPPAVAENGSYYGEISERTGLPRTNYVNGYYRRNGTYVQSYYRSP